MQELTEARVKLKKKLRNRERLFAGWVSYAHPSITETFARAGFDFIERLLRTPTEPYYWGWFHTGVGAVVMSLLMWVRWRFIGWPLHPLGYTISANWKTGHIFCAAIVAWLLKLVILKYGGPKLYQDTKPFFLGLILGEIMGAGAWLVLDYFSGHTDSFLTQI